MENMEIKNNFWINKRVLVTGHTGFKGSWLCLWLQKLGANVYGISLKPKLKINMFDICSVSDEMNSIISDIRDFDSLSSTIKKIKPEIVFHMAAQSLVGYSYNYPLETYQTNLMGTVNLLESIRYIDSVRVIINVTSDKCYENKESFLPFKEEDYLCGRDPYSNSKSCSELATFSYRNSFFKNENSPGLATARAGNVIGGGDWAEDRLIPDFMRAAFNGTVLKVRNPKSIRPWQHVLEPIHGYLLLAQKIYFNPAIFSESWNFGPSDDSHNDVSWLINELNNNWSNKIEFEYVEKFFHEANLLKLDSNKAKKLLNWQSKWNAKNTVAKVSNWYKSYMDNQDMLKYTLKEIDYYEKSSF